MGTKVHVIPPLPHLQNQKEVPVRLWRTLVACLLLIIRPSQWNLIVVPLSLPSQYYMILLTNILKETLSFA